MLSVVSKDRHQKSAIAAALSDVPKHGFDLERIHNKGHLWGKLYCTTCGAAVSINSTPRVPENTARTIEKFVKQHRHENVAEKNEDHKNVRVHRDPGSGAD